MDITVYVLGKVEPVFTGSLPHIPETGQRVMVEEAHYFVESIVWTLKGGTVSVSIYLGSFNHNRDIFR